MESEGCQERVLGETTGTGGHLRRDTETQCSENSLESTGVDLVKLPSNGGFGAQTGHLLYPGKAPSSGTRTSAQPQSLHTAICPAYKMC